MARSNAKTPSIFRLALLVFFGSVALYLLACAVLLGPSLQAELSSQLASDTLVAPLFISDTPLPPIGEGWNPSKVKKGPLKVTSHHCIGDETPGLEKHVCHFKNMCFVNGTALYLTRNGPSHIPHLMTESSAAGEFLDAFPQKFMVTSIYALGTWWRPKVIDIESIDGSVDIQWPVSPHNTAILHTPFNPENFGHVLADDMLPMWKILNYFGMYSRDVIPIIMTPLDRVFENRRSELKAKMTNRSRLLWSQLLPYLFDTQSPIYVNDLSPQSMFCIPNAIIGSHGVSYSHSYHSFDIGHFLSIFHNHPWHINQVRLIRAERVKEGNQRILLLTKHSGLNKRSWANDDEIPAIATQLSRLFNVSIDILDDKQLTTQSLRQQISTILPYTVIISPSGALSLAALFLLDGCACIVKDAHNYELKTTLQLDKHLFRYNYRQKIFFMRSDNRSHAHFLLDWDKMVAKGESQLRNAFMYAADYPLIMDQIVTSLFNALVWVEAYYGWNNSFQYPSLK